eukprot:TRINITY_DN10812_c0_g1_i1.p1 TRINITY_DN10812_c0_g1~~TRINITY_DN10812_c0_g1_i1.p1  ORF type:complete len:755 (+),score=199.90 TRINITY_DN10812_c0_g1_i1:96-2360(+)
MPKVFILEDYAGVCDYAAQLVVRRIAAAEGGEFVLGLPTPGSIAQGIYHRLARHCQEGRVSFARVHTFSSDALCGVGRATPGSSRRFAWENLLRHIDIPPKNVHVLDGSAADLVAECARYEAELKKHAVDLWLCTVGPSGHLAFNEPGSSLASRTRPKTLARRTLSRLAADFGGADAVPRRALTIGVATVLEAREMMVVLSGSESSRDVAALCEGSVGQMRSLSAMQLHRQGVVICDYDSCERLTSRMYQYYKLLQNNVLHNELLRSPGADAAPEAGVSVAARITHTRIAAAAARRKAASGLAGDGQVTQITNVLLLRGGSLVDDDLWICDGKIIDPSERFWEARKHGEYAADRVVDGGGAVCAPGLIDVQINGAFGIDFTSTELKAEDVDTVCRGVLAHGCTAICPTVITSSREFYQQVLPLLKRRAGSAERGASILGAHVEGPFLSELKYGAHDKAYCATPTNGFASVVQTYGKMDCISVVTLAPELKGACDAIAGLTARGLRVSLGHSNATLSEAERGLQSGANMVTHMFNAMRSFQHRDPGLVGLLGSAHSQRPYYGIIVDGLHAHPASVRMAYQSHPQGCVLVTDAMEAMGMPPGQYKLAGRDVTVEEAQVRGGLGVGDVGVAHRAVLSGTSTLAGAVPTLIECVRNLCTFTGCDFVRALEAAALHPARFLGIQHRKGTLDFGADADFVLLSAPRKGEPPAQALRVLSTWVAGTEAWSAPQPAAAASQSGPADGGGSRRSRRQRPRARL